MSQTPTAAPLIPAKQGGFMSHKQDEYKTATPVEVSKTSTFYISNDSRPLWFITTAILWKYEELASPLSRSGSTSSIFFLFLFSKFFGSSPHLLISPSPQLLHTTNPSSQFTPSPPAAATATYLSSPPLPPVPAPPAPPAATHLPIITSPPLLPPPSPPAVPNAKSSPKISKTRSNGNPQAPPQWRYGTTTISLYYNMRDIVRTEYFTLKQELGEDGKPNWTNFFAHVRVLERGFKFCDLYPMTHCCRWSPYTGSDHGSHQPLNLQHIYHFPETLSFAPPPPELGDHGHRLGLPRHLEKARRIHSIQRSDAILRVYRDEVGKAMAEAAMAVEVEVEIAITVPLP
ncbi:hypothetical protein EX30DRAFT_373212 [Ascodesmis nigricans]|uniref:Uncharacterized protein n=1 Tax=Ascodesmis nigricans TaxID=341454 RepID=A0A4S2MPY7_9PEZI|nr:hypothetical protein EX30DRAFT_373212 [Ascodesmis nigricans]